jgi:hypothetical protein
MIDESLARAWRRWDTWPTWRETTFQATASRDSARFLFSLQAFLEGRSLLAAAGTVAVRNATFQKEIILFRDTGSWVSPPLPVGDPQLPKPVSDGCGRSYVFWKDSQRGQDIWFARLAADRWSAPKRIPSLPKPAWAANQNGPIRLPACRVALVVVARDTATGQYQHRLVVVADTVIAQVRAVAGDGVFSQSDIAGKGRRLTYAYMRYILPGRHTITFVGSGDEGATWKRLREDTLPRNSIAQSIHMIAVGGELWFGRVEGQDFSALGERRLVVGPLAQRATFSTTFADSGWTEYVMTGSACNAPMLV